MPRTVKIAPEIDAKLYEELVAVAKENGQSQRFVLERALEHYLHIVVPSQRMVRPEVMAAYRRSNEKFRELYKRLASNARAHFGTISTVYYKIIPLTQGVCATLAAWGAHSRCVPKGNCGSVL
jgi:hypothetical protein